DALRSAEEINSIRLVACELTLDPKELRVFADKAMSALGSGALVVGAASDDKVNVIIRVSEDLVGKGIRANDWIKEIGPFIQGGGGGKPNAAQAGGTAPEGLKQAFQKVRELLAV
ncbi:MAG: alanine--tRNA ligase, partial [Chlamydiia bacterium]|nr:alanine--tRNA ligase [Chlamydiia bacterium]